MDISKLKVGDILIFRRKEDIFLRWGHAAIYLGPKIVEGSSNYALIYHILRSHGRPSVDLILFKPGNNELSVLRYTGEDDFTTRFEKEIPTIIENIQKTNYNYNFFATMLVPVVPCFLDLEPPIGLICSTLIVLVFRELLHDKFPLSFGCSPANLRRLSDTQNWIRFEIKNIDDIYVQKNISYV